MTAAYTLSQFVSSANYLTLPNFEGVCASCGFDIKYYSDSLYRHYKIHFPAALQTAPVQRKAEFLAGRITANLAFIKLGLRAEVIEIGKHRNPVWPPAVRGSITHHNSSAYCMMIPSSTGVSAGISPGIDLESYLTASESTSLASGIASSIELELVSAHFPKFERGLTLIFSAKESLFKAFYPAVGRYFDFLDVRVSSISVENRELQLILLCDLSPTCLTGDTITVYWQENAETILSWVLPN
ncbi:4'-phosphopantetheinyl transferase family protein [Zhongshania sp.]|uniref:4'-phosphopantetheinyl transferase family protein n=1 Tax=Zhongshania sp. TaxID=1971902 RepID=UPI0039E3CB0A